MVINGHNFSEYKYRKDAGSGYLYYQCDVCYIVIMYSKDGFDHNESIIISSDFNKNTKHADKLLSCNDYIIKNILE